MAVNAIEVTLNQDVKALVPTAAINPRFLFWKLKGQGSDVLSFCNKIGATVDSIEMEYLMNFPISVPPLQEQAAIANYLDEKTARLDKLAADKQCLIELLKEERTAVIKHAVTHGIRQNVKTKPTGFEWLGDIPKHWTVKKAKYLLENFDNLRKPVNATDRGDVEKVYDYYGASGVIDKVGGYLFEGEFILLGEDGANLLARNSPLAFKASGKFWVNNHAHILKPFNGSLDYFMHLLESIDYTTWVTGSAQPKLTSERLMNIEILEPPLNEQQAIANFIDNQIERVDITTAQIQSEIALIQEYRDALICEVVTGKIKVI